MIPPLLIPLFETAPFLAGIGPGRGYVNLERPDGTVVPFPVPVHSFQTQRRVNATGNFAVAIPVDIRLDDAGTLASDIVTGWRVTIRQEGNNPYGAWNTALMTRGRVNGRSYQIAEGAALIVLKGNFRTFDIAREELHGEFDYENQNGRAVAQAVSGQVINFKGGDDTPLSLKFTGGTRLAATLKVLQILRATLRESWAADNLEAVDVFGVPNSSVTLTTVEQVDPTAVGLAFGNNGSLPNQSEGGFALIADAPSFAYDGSNLMNTIIPYGLDGDGTDLTLEHVDIFAPPFPIAQLAGGKWAVYDQDSIDNYGDWDQRVYWPDIRNPFDAKASGLFTLIVPPTDGDNFIFGTEMWTYRTVPTTPGDILIGVTLQASFENTRNAILGADGFNPASEAIDGIIQIAPLVMRFTSALKGEAGNVTTTNDFADPANGFNRSTAIGGAYSTATANALYWRAVNELITYRSEILVVQCHVANGADVWALPGDRIGFRYRGLAATIESNGEVYAWLDVDQQMLVTAREDRLDPSGVRQVRLTVCAPSLQFQTPPIPGWDSPVALPVPDRIDAIATFKNLPGVPEPPADLVDAYRRLITRSGTGTSPCCPNPDSEHRGGAQSFAGELPGG